MAKSSDIPQFGMLSGVKVLSSGVVVAEPFAAALMAEHGADVIHVESTRHPETTRCLTLSWAQDARNRRALSLDLASPKGREIFCRLLQWADIWMESSKGGTYDKWGLTDEYVHSAINPKLVIVHVSGYGQTGVEEYVKRGSYDPIAQAFSGYMFLNGAPEPQPPMIAQPGTGDFVTGLFALWSALAGLVKASRTGKGEVIDVSQYESLLRISAHHPSTYFTTGEQSMRTGNASNMVGGFDVYQCKDGKYVYVAMNVGSCVKRGISLLGLENDPDFPPDLRLIRMGTPTAPKLDQAIKNYCRRFTAQQVDETFNAAGIPCSEVMEYKQIGENPQVKARENIVEWFDEASEQYVKGIGVLPKVKYSPGRIWRGSAKYGQDNEDILEELGFGEEEIAGLYRDKIIVKEGV